MSNGQDRGERSIDEIAEAIVDSDPSNGSGRPGKNLSKSRFLKRPTTWVAALILLGAVVGVVVATSGHGSPAASGGKIRSFAGYFCQGDQFTLFSNANAEAVSNGGSDPTFSTHGKAYCLMYVQTYHWNKGAGSPPGTVGVVRLSGPAKIPKYIASLPAKTSKGQNGAPNVNWFATVSIAKPVILDGTYACTDSDPSTWSSDKASGGGGFCLVYADLAMP